MENQELEYAGFWKRCWAYLIDWLFLMIALSALLVIFLIYFIAFEYIAMDLSGLPSDATEAEIITYIENDVNAKRNEEMVITGAILVVGIWSFFSVLLLSLLTAGKKQATWGKRMLKIYVVQKNGGSLKKPSFFVCLGRYGLLWVFSWGFILAFKDHFLAEELTFNHIDIIYYVVFFAWYLTMPFTKEKTTIHDMLFKTRVVMGKVN